MHSAIFTLVTVPDGLAADVGALKKLRRDFVDPVAGELFESMAGRADYVQECGESDNWHFADLECYLEGCPFINVRPEHVICFTEDKSYIRAELLRRLAMAQQLLANTKCECDLLYRVSSIIGGADDYYINVVDTANQQLDFMPLSRFLLDDGNVGRAYMLAAVNDYHC